MNEPKIAGNIAKLTKQIKGFPLHADTIVEVYHLCGLKLKKIHLILGKDVNVVNAIIEFQAILKVI